MPIVVESTTDAPEAVVAVSDLAQKAEEVEGQENQNSKESAATDTTAEESEKVESLDSDEESENAGEEEQQEQKKPGGFKRQINKLNKKLSAEAQEKEYWRNQALRAQSLEKKTEEPIKAIPSGKPKADDFSTHEEFVEALTDWKLDQKLQTREAKQKEEAVKSEHQTKLEKHQARVSKFAEAREDWDDVIESIGTMPLTLAVQESIIESDMGPELMYEFGKNPDELKRICALAPLLAAKEIGRIEARLSKPAATEEKKTTKAPPPIAPVKARAGNAVKKSIYDPDLSQRDFERLRIEQIKSRSAY